MPTKFFFFFLYSRVGGIGLVLSSMKYWDTSIRVLISNNIKIERDESNDLDKHDRYTLKT